MRFLFSLLFCAALALGAPLAARAETALGGSLGSARVNGGDFEGSDTGFKAFLGSYGEVLGGEIGYVDFGKLGGRSDGPEANAWAPALTLGIPLGGIRIGGKVGVSFPEVEGASVNEEFEQEEAFYGVGLRTGGSAPLGFRLEYERFQVGGEDVDLASAGLEFRFGSGIRKSTISEPTTGSR